ncbi:Pvc16 family protein [Streptomyces phyllanthi]|uniref:DUF4255 domain-containing protein n=1 Tax=Streptomyces phyllanthi TaxID=1803180 RepID=A0A5N8W408_9ACTN|nr:DUF4255 domain-containing protein [Streptomyces phyllanthi]MPY42227.1 DUF4255 domain-containing protein [Streptomyces phyllanthi]
MSNALAIAHVSQALALLIADNLRPEFDEAVQVEPRKPPAEPPSVPTISVFCYQVTPDVSQRNNDLPTRAADGTLRKRPAAALDLHYLISAYGEESELVAQRLLGAVIRTLHEIPVLPKDVIERAGEKPYLAASDLAETAQRVRFTPTVMDVDETSKLWGMLYQTPYTLSVVYQAALVFIEGRETPVPVKPVERPDVRVLPFGAPGAPVPPGAAGNGEPVSGGGTEGPDAASQRAADKDVVKAESTAAAAEAPVRAPSRAPARTAAKTPAKTPAKAPAKTSARSAAKAPARSRKAAEARSGDRGERGARGPRNTDGGPTTGSGDDQGTEN